MLISAARLRSANGCFPSVQSVLYTMARRPLHESTGFVMYVYPHAAPMPRRPWWFGAAYLFASARRGQSALAARTGASAAAQAQRAPRALSGA